MLSSQETGSMTMRHGMTLKFFSGGEPGCFHDDLASYSDGALIHPSQRTC